MFSAKSSEKGPEPQLEVTESELFVPNNTSGKVIKWHTQLDSMTLFAGVVAIAVGIIGLIDGSLLDKKKRITPFHDGWFQGDTGPLIIYGIATAGAWTCSLRAIFRIAAIEAAPVLARGVRQRDLSDMFEMKFPSRRWLAFRLKMWKTTIYAIVCVVIYGSAAVTYRLAFTIREQWRLVDGLDGWGSYPVLGCTTNFITSDVVSGKLAMFEHLLSPNVAGNAIFAASSNDFGNFESRVSNPEWDVQMGWYDGNLFSSRTDNARGWWEGPLLVGVTQPIAAPDMPTNKTVQVGDHPQCGRMLQACTVDGVSCYWLGLGGGNFQVNFTSRIHTEPRYSIVNGSWSTTESDNHCPISLNSTVYDKVVSDMVDDFGMKVFDPTNAWLVSGDPSQYQANKTLHALLISHVNLNHSVIDNPAPLIDLGLLKDPNDECYQVGNIVGELWDVYSIRYFPQYQVTASVLLVLWGLMLLFAGWPFRRLLIAGSLDQWMAFGADLGRVNMGGASSGRVPSRSNTLWVLKAGSKGVGREEWRRIEFEEVVERDVGRGV